MNRLNDTLTRSQEDWQEMRADRDRLSLESLAKEMRLAEMTADRDRLARIVAEHQPHVERQELAISDMSRELANARAAHRMMSAAYDGKVADCHALSTKLAAVEAERDEARERLGKMDSGASMPLAAALRSATQGTVHVQDDGALPGGRHNVYRIVLDEDARRFREDYESTARPPYLATVYSKENAELYRVAHNVLPRLIEHHRSALAEVEALRERVHNERFATVAYLLDRAEQYSNSSGYRALFDELVGGIAEGEHAVSLREGEYDDMRKRLDRIFATHTPKDALSPTTPRGKGGADE
jgi:hypothetical protein